MSAIQQPEISIGWQIMVANWIGSAFGGELDDDEPGRERVIALSERRSTPVRRKSVARAQKSLSAAIHYFGGHFTLIDQTILAAWADDTSHGYDRLTVERGVLEDGTWTSYALAYVPGQAWSTWGLLRRGEHVEVWRCSSGKTLGWHERMADALASLPHATARRGALPSEFPDRCLVMSASSVGVSLPAADLRPRCDGFLINPTLESPNTIAASD